MKRSIYLKGKFFFLGMSLSIVAHAGMSTPGSLTADESGAALYTVPIELPPGVAGVAPRIALVHNSQGGNGLLGMGWSLSGLSSITRCAQTKAQDGVGAKQTINYSATDRFCLDGQRLIAVSGVYGADGTEYRTEQDSFAKIKSYGVAGSGPEKFKVWSKSGQTMEYGFTADARIEAVKATNSQASWPAGTVAIWALNTHTDTKGNYFTITYTEDSANADSYPSRIDYTGNFSANTTPTNSILFGYENRVDVVPIFHGGSVSKTMKRLNTIQVLSNNSMVRDYRLSYEYGVKTNRSIIKEIQLCAPDNTCVLPIDFEYPSTSVGFTNYKLNTVGRGFDGFQFDAADFNGDGKTDYIYIADGTNGTIKGSEWFVFLSNGDQTFSAPIRSAFPGNMSGYQLMIGDYNGDGYADILYMMDGSLGGTFYKGRYKKIFMGRGDGQFDSTMATESSHVYNSFDFLPGDFNGDGLSDYMFISDGSENTSYSYSTTRARGAKKRVHLNMGNGVFSAPYITDESIDLAGYELIMGDYNGDGNTDLMYITDGTLGGDNYRGSKRRIFLSNGDGYFKPVIATTLGTILQNFDFAAGDYNGDGKTDYMAISNGKDPANTNDAKGKRTVVYFSNGDGSFQSGWYRTTQDNFAGRKLVVGDINSDGKSDYMYISDGTNGTISGKDRTVYLSMGNGSFSGAISTTSNINFNGHQFVSGDFNGDGKADYMYVHATSSKGYYTYVYHATPTDEMLDVPLTITGAKDHVTTLKHLPLSNNAVYTRDRNAVYPVVDAQSPLYVLSSMTTSDGIGGTLTTNYKYGGLKADMTGRGMQGFRWREEHQVESGLSTRTEFRQDWPYSGMISSVRTTLAGSGYNGLLSESVNTFACIDTATSAACTSSTKRFYPHVSQNINRTWDLNGAAMPTATTTKEYDSWGSPTKITMSMSDGHSKTTVNTFAPADTQNWFLSRLIKSTVTSTSP